MPTESSASGSPDVAVEQVLVEVSRCDKSS
jgi:hypothetical protein